MVRAALALRTQEAAEWSVAMAVWPLHLLLSAPAYLYLATLTIMLFRPPDLDLYHLDRFAFVLLCFVAILRALWRGTTVVQWRITLPMSALLVLAVASAAAQPFDPQTWSLLSAEFLVPFALFHLAGVVFDDQDSRHKFEIFAVLVLAYLSFQAIVFLVGATGLVFPRYILDESVGIHIDRARGPFLQAVANGVSLIVLALIVIDCYRRRTLSWAGRFVLASVPVAVFATMTRAVWIAALFSIVGLMVVVRSAHVRRACCGLLLTAAIALGVLFSVPTWRDAWFDRATEAGPVEIRAAIYEASWDMIRERPLLGWGQNRMPSEVARRMPDYDLDAYWAHNTYLEVLVEHGAVGLGLYLCVIVALFRLPRLQQPSSGDTNLGTIWPIIFAVYLFNAMFVVMNYQFVNALVYTIAGIVARDPDTAES